MSAKPERTQRPTETPESFGLAIHKLQQARDFSGPPNLFWPACLESLASVAGASLGLLLVKTKEEGEVWKKMSLWSSDTAARAKVRTLEREIDELTRSFSSSDFALHELNSVQGNSSEGALAAVRLDVRPSPDDCFAVFLLPDSSPEIRDESLARLRLVANTPTLYQSRRVSQLAKADIERLSTILDLVAQVNEEQRYMAAAMTVCNELAARHQCERVSLGWLEKEYIRLQAISHTEKFERKMDAVQNLEAAMEECLDQDEEVLFPPPEGDNLVTRDHQTHATSQGARFLCSIPLRLQGKPAAVLTLERNSEKFSDEELQVLHLCLDMAGRRLADLKKADRWFGARLAETAREKAAKLVGVEHTGWKLLAILLTIALAVLVFGKITYRVEAPFTLHAAKLVHVPALANGFIEQVHIRLGDKVDEGALLLDFDKKDLRLEEASSMAELGRYLRETEKARAAGNLSEMQIAQALSAQAKAQLDLIRLQLDQTVVKAPFTGIIVEGDLEELVGAPVKKGDLLFKIAQLDSLYVESTVHERDVDEIRDAATGEIAFASRPDLEFPVQIERLDPVAQAKDEGNFFSVRSKLTGEIQDWWRPGMTGKSKINVEKRTFLWIFTHRTMDFLRLWLWW